MNWSVQVSCLGTAVVNHRHARCVEWLVLSTLQVSAGTGKDLARCLGIIALVLGALLLQVAFCLCLWSKKNKIK